jgi:uncharacterized Rossmann fold enzyme
MKLGTWIPLYERICRDFGFDPTRDRDSAIMLAKKLGQRSDDSLKAARSRVSSTVFVCGGGPNLADDISMTDIRWPIIAADSATTTLLGSGINPDIIVSDLDGVVEDQIEANSHGAPIFVHAHGDNMRALDRYVGLFEGAVVGTCQCKPLEHVFNFGGFTDGDRAACIAAELGAKEVLLAGFDFKNPAAKPGKNSDVKKRKLAWARIILEELAKEGIRVIPVGDYVTR